MKKQWETPELIIIGRSNPEEAVLYACKGREVSPPQSGPNHNFICAAPGPDPNNWCYLETTS